MAEFVCRTQFSTSVPLAMVILPCRRNFFNKCIGNWRKMTRDRTCWAFESNVVRRRTAVVRPSYGVVRSLRDKSFGHPENYQKSTLNFIVFSPFFNVFLAMFDEFWAILSKFGNPLGVLFWCFFGPPVRLSFWCHFSTNFKTTIKVKSTQNTAPVHRTKPSPYWKSLAQLWKNASIFSISFHRKMMRNQSKSKKNAFCKKNQ